MKKKIYFWLVLCNIFLCINSYASIVDINRAKQVAINFMSSKGNYNITVNNVQIKSLNNVPTLYIVNFNQGGWVIIAADDSSYPVAAYNKFGVYSDIGNEPLVELISIYSHQVSTGSLLKSTNSDIADSWDRYSSSFDLKSINYSSNDWLLNTEKGDVRWGQGKNNSGTCTPSYNAKVNSSSNSDCDCGHKPVGCAAVAMGQVMWYWEWPTKYDWNNIPSSITSNTESTKASNIASLLKDCGTKANTSYTFCSGAWTTINNTEEAMVDGFAYKSSLKKKRSGWDHDDAWLDLLRSEIDCGRPIIYRGDKADLSTEKHIFICDGYDQENPDFFHFNWGWRGSYQQSGDPYFSLRNLNPGSSNFTKNQMAIVGISPSYDSYTGSISSVNYSSVKGTTQEIAGDNITLPAQGKELIIETNSNYTLTSGKTIILKPGFHALKGSDFSAKIAAIRSKEDTDIKVEKWINGFSPNNDGINDVLTFKVSNADSWECEIFDVSDQPIFQSAGLIVNGEANVWDGSEAPGNSFEENFLIGIRFKNNYGRSLGNAYVVSVRDNRKSASLLKAIEIDDEADKPISENLNNKSVNFTVYPNPFTDEIKINTSRLFDYYDYSIVNVAGNKLLDDTTVGDTVIKTDSFISGIYIVIIRDHNGMIHRYKVVK